jgi:hypothetical protein
MTVLRRLFLMFLGFLSLGLLICGAVVFGSYWIASAAVERSFAGAEGGPWVIAKAGLVLDINQQGSGSTFVPHWIFRLRNSRGYLSPVRFYTTLSGKPVEYGFGVLDPLPALGFRP